MTIHKDDSIIKKIQLCLDFANTVSAHASDHPESHLQDYSDLIGWAVRKSLVDEARAKNLEGYAKNHPVQTRETFEYAIALREVIYRIFTAVSAGLPPNPEDLEALNLSLEGALQHARVVPSDEGFTWGWKEVGTLEEILWPVARSAAELLTSQELLSRVGQCADAECGWLFIDTSKNHSRKWCDIRDCGNREKQRRMRRKKAVR
jgi:predicted RNA-binding Zn ribbon-like protein